MKKSRYAIGFIVMTSLMIGSVVFALPSDIRVLRGRDWNPIMVDDQRWDFKKIMIQDVMSDLKSTFLPIEKKRGFKEHSYYKFVLRDSKLSCFIKKYCRREMDIFKEIKRGERITIVGRVYRAGKGMRRLVNPKFIFKVEAIRKGWVLSEEDEILSDPPVNKEITYLEINPEDISIQADKYDGEYVRYKDIFSLSSTFYTNYEKDLNLSNSTALKFRGEFSPLPCYLSNGDDNRGILSHLKSGDKITVLGKLHIRPIPEDRLVLLSVHRIEKGWN